MCSVTKDMFFHLWVVVFFMNVGQACTENYIPICDKHYGPSGETFCRKSKNYEKFQYATCVTDTYLRLVSGERHVCGDGRTYCYYYCMLEEHGRGNGPVYDDCACGPDVPVTLSTRRPTKPAPEIPDWCYSPDGTGCTFYRDCVEKKYPCSNGGNSYAINFGEKFCKLYEENANKFTDVGQRWIDAVRKCLQVALVSLLRPYEKPTCDDIKERAFSSHSSCYLNPYPGAPSICDIGFENWLQVMATVKSSLDWKLWKDGVLEQNHEIVGEALTVIWDCKWDIPFETLRIGLNVSESIFGSYSDLIDDIFKVVDDIRKAIGNGFNQEDVYMYPLIPAQEHKKRAADYTADAAINVIIAPRSKYDLNYNGEQNVNVSEIIDYFLDAVTTKKFYPYLPAEIHVENYRVCADTDCQNSSRIVQQPEPEPKHVSEANSVHLAMLAIYRTVVMCLIWQVFGDMI